MKKFLFAILGSLVLLSGCLTSDYNLRVINDPDRYYMGTHSDSTETLMKWNTPDWKSKNLKYWRSGGVIITNPYNAFDENQWLADLVTDGFEGTVFVEDDLFDHVHEEFAGAIWKSGDGTWYNTSYDYKKSKIGGTNSEVLYSYPGLASVFIDTNASIWPYSTRDLYHLNPLVWTNAVFMDGYIDLYITEFALTTVDIGDTESVVKFGVCLDDYEYDEWVGSNKVANLGKIDPSAIGKSFDTYTPTEVRTLMSPSQNAKIERFSQKNIDIIVKGTRLTTDLATNIALQSKQIVGYFFDEVNAANVVQIESDIADMRSVNEALIPEDALLLIAGVKNDVYHDTQPTDYGTLIKRLIDAGMYFTPGADNDHWNMPMTNPGDWWIRENDDHRWQGNAPDYASFTVGPRKIMIGVDEVFVYNQVGGSIGMGGGGWLDATAIGHNDQYVMLGADISGAYLSTNGGITFEHINDGMDNEDDKENQYVNDIVPISNTYFDGFVIATQGGLYSLADGSKTFVDMTPSTNGTDMWVGEKGMLFDESNPTKVLWGQWVGGLTFHEIEWDGNNFMIAATGHYRWNNKTLDDRYYPQNYVTNNFTNPMGRVGLVRYDFTDGNGWQPIGGANSWKEEYGNYRDISMVVTGGDTLIVIATTKAGPKLWNITDDKWTDLAARPWIGPEHWDENAGAIFGDGAWVNGEECFPRWNYFPETGKEYVSTYNIHVTDRLTAYVTIGRGVTDYYGNVVSGVYRYHNITGDYNWEWVGDHTDMDWDIYPGGVTPITFDEAASGGLGRYSDLSSVAQFLYLSVEDGTAIGPDKLYVSDRRHRFGISKTSVPYGVGSSYDQKQTWEDVIWLSSFTPIGVRPWGVGIYPGYNSAMQWGGIITPPGHNPDNFDDFIFQMGVSIHRTYDGGTTWYTSDPIKPVPTNELINTTSGYEESCPSDLAVLGDGRLVISNADFGLAVSTDSDWDQFENNLVWHNDITTDYSDPGELTIGSHETTGLGTVDDWNGTGRVALFYCTSNAIQYRGWAGFTMHWDSNGDGNEETFDILYDIAQGSAVYDPDGIAANRGYYLYPFKFKTMFYAANNVDFYMPYFWNDENYGGSVWKTSGVHKLHWDGTNWSVEEFDNFYDENYGGGGSGWALPNRDGRRQMHEGIQHSVSENKLFLCESADTDGAHTTDPSGHIWACDLDDVTPEWRPIFGYNSAHGVRVDPRAFDLSADGTTLYVGGRGEEGFGITAIWKLTDLDQAQPTVTQIINDTAASTPMFPPAPASYGKILTDKFYPNLSAAAGDEYKSWQTKGVKIRGLLVNPLNADQIWITYNIYWNNNDTNAGVWAMDTSTKKMVHANYAEKDGDKIRYVDENLIIDQFHSPWRIVYGADCQGAMYQDWDQIFPTDADDEFVGTEDKSTPDPPVAFAKAYDGTIRVFWNEAINAVNIDFAGYDVYRSLTSGSGFSIVANNILSGAPNRDGHRVYEDNTVVNGTPYYYTVRTVYDGGTSETIDSNEVTATPYQQIGITSEKLGINSLEWDWNDTAIDTVSTVSPFDYSWNTKSAYGFVTSATAPYYTVATVTPGKDITVNSNDVTVSAYIKKIGDEPQDFTFRFYDVTDAVQYQIKVGWANYDDSDVSIVEDNTDGSGIEEIGNGWYRAWFTIDVLAAAAVGNDFYIRFFPWTGVTDIGVGAYIWGVQIDFDVTTPREYRPEDPRMPSGTISEKDRMMAPYGWNKPWLTDYPHWITETSGCSEGTNNIFTPPYNGVTAYPDTGSVDFSLIYDDVGDLWHIFNIPGGLLEWNLHPNGAFFEHYTSKDLRYWNIENKVIISTDDTGYPTNNIWAPHIIKHGSTWYMFYTAVNNTAPDNSSKHVERMAVSTSTDLFTWSNGSVVLEGDDYKSGVATFTAWEPETSTGRPAWRGSCRDGHIIRNENDNGWLIFVSLDGNGPGDGGVIAYDGLLVGIAESLDSNFGGNSALSLVGRYELYDYVLNTTNGPVSAWAESPHVWEKEGLYYLEWSTNFSPKGYVVTTTTPSDGEYAGNSWSTRTDFPYKAMELVEYTTGDYAMAWLDINPHVGGIYFSIWFQRYYCSTNTVDETGTHYFSDIFAPDCYNEGIITQTVVATEYTWPLEILTASYPLGGHTWSSAIGHDENYWALGGDVGGTWVSRDLGISWNSFNSGVANDQDQPVHYTRDLISVKNSYYEGFIMANDSGIWKLPIPFTLDDSWSNMIDVTDNDYLSYQHWSWADWLEVIPFGSLDWDDNNLLVATTGHHRYHNSEYESYYPWNVADGDTLTGDIDAATWLDGDWSDNTFGKVGLWIYDYTKSSHDWHPVEAAYDSYKQKWGRYKSVDVAIVGSDTLYVVATSSGPKLLTVTSSSKTWTDIDEYNWYDVDSVLMDDPLFTTRGYEKTVYHYKGPPGGDGGTSIGNDYVTIVEEIQSSTPSSGTITVGGLSYAYSSWSGSTFFLNAVTLTTEVSKGSEVIESTWSQSTESVMVTNRGDIYCVIMTVDRQWNGDSGLYKLHSGETNWKWVGDGTGLVQIEGGQDIVGTGLLSVADVGYGSWNDNPLSQSPHNFIYTDYPAGQFGDGFVWVSGVEGSSTDPDTLYMSGNASVRSFRALVDYGSSGAGNTTWSQIIGRDYTYDPIREIPYPDLEPHANIIDTGANYVIHEFAVDPENSNRLFITPGDQGFYSIDGGINWVNNVYENNSGDANFFKSTGYDEIVVTGVAALSDGRLISARGDVYAGISYDNTWEHSGPFRPLNSGDFEDCETQNNDDVLWGPETAGVLSILGWDSANPTEDYIIFNNVDSVQENEPSKVFLVHDDNDDGDFYDSGEWVNTNADLTDANKYIYPSNCVTDGVTKIWSSYQFYQNAICAGGGTIQKYGVMEHTDNRPSNWTYNDIGQVRIDSLNIRPYKLEYDPDENRLWMAARFESEGGGGIYMRDLDEGSGTWLAIMGTGARDEYLSYEPLGAFESIALSDDGSVIYFGSTGRSGKQGGIWRISNPDAATNAFTIDKVLNTSGKAYAPTITTSRFYNSRAGDGTMSAEELAGQRLMCSDILIDPFSNNKLWFITGGNYNRMSSHQGLYALDVSTNEFAQVFPDDPMSYFGETRGGVSLIYSDATDPPRIVWGTHGLGVSFFEYNGTFPTDW